MQISHKVQSNFHNINMEQGQELNCYTFELSAVVREGGTLLGNVRNVAARITVCRPLRTPLCWESTESFPLAIFQPFSKAPSVKQNS